MMKTLRALVVALLFASSFACVRAQAVNAAQTVTLAGLRAGSGHGGFPAAAYGTDGSLFLLYDQGDGVRVLKLNAAGTTVLAQAQFGAKGDSAIAMAIDPTGSVYVTGTTTSGTLSGTSGAAFPTAADTSTNSFLAKLDSSLSTKFITFLGSGRTAAAAVSATADAAFVTGITFSSAFPVTSAGAQQAPAAGTSENGFAERFSADGTTLVYATYLTGVNGSTVPTGIVADSSDNAYVAGSTSSTGYPTTAALIARSTDAASGFLTKLTPAGDGFTFSTFLPGTGVTGLALDAADATLLLTGNMARGEIPLGMVAAPLGPVTYVSLLRIPVNGQTVSGSVVLLPGTQALVSAGPGGTAWVTGVSGARLFPGTSRPLAMLGDSFALRVTAANIVDQTVRLGGQAAGTFTNGKLTSVPAAPAISADGSIASFAATLSATIGAGLASTQRFDLPFVTAPNAALPNTLRDVVASCGATGQCSATAGYLTQLAIAGGAPSLAVSFDNSPNLLLRNLGTTTAAGLALTASGFTLQSNCGSSLAASGVCAVALSGTGPGMLAASAANAPTASVALPANALAPDPLAVLPVELDFGIETSADAPRTQTFTVTNLSATSQVFTSALDSSAVNLPYTFAQAATTCASAGGGSLTLAGGASCTITLGLTVSSNSGNDGAIRTAWKVGTHDIALDAVAEAAALNLSSAAVSFGTQFVGGIALPRYLFLSNNSNTAFAHTAVQLPAASPFAVADECASTIEAHSVCRLTLTYASSTAPSADEVTLTLDGGISVPVTGQTLPRQGVTASTPNPNMVVSPTSITFVSPVVVTGVSTETQTVTVMNSGTAAVPVAIGSAGDILLQNGCPAVLASGASCQVVVSFAPSQPGTRQGLVTVTGGSGFSPAYVSVSATATAILPANNGTFGLGETLVGEPLVMWIKVGQPLASLTAAISDPAFGVALVEDTGFGHGTLPQSAFAQTATGTCRNCYLGVQFLSPTAGAHAATVSLSTVAGGHSEVLTLTATALPVSGLLLTPIAQDFGTVSINSSSAPQVFTLTNLLTTGAATSITSSTTSGDFTTVASTGGAPACTGTLAYGASCFLTVAFAPAGLEVRSGALTVVTGGGTASAVLTGFGEADPGVALNPVELDFDAIPGTAALQQSVAVSNTGAVPLSIGSVVSTNASFIPASQCGTLAPGAMCTITVAFTPGFATAAGALQIPVSATVNGQATTTTYSVALSGNYTAQDAGLQILPAQVNFGTEATGNLSAPRQFTLTNLTGKTVAVQLSLPRQFPLNTDAACASLPAFGTCTFTVAYLPATAAEATGSVLATATPTDGSAALQTLAYMQGYGEAAGALTVSGSFVPNAPLSFGQVNSGQTSQQTLTLTNSGMSAVNVRRITSEPPFLSTTTCTQALAAAQTCSITVTYAPSNQVATGSAAAPARVDTGSLTIESDAAASPQTTDLTGSAVAVQTGSPVNAAVLAAYQLSTSALTFGHVTVGNASAIQTITLTNTGTTTVHLLASAASADFSVTTTCAAVLPGASCIFSIAFTPSNTLTGTTRTSALEISTDAADALEFVTLLGTADAPALTLTPGTLNFGTVNVGASDQLTATLTNSTAAAVTLGAVNTTGDYAVALGTCPQSGSTLAAGAACTLTLTFKPVATGSRTGVLSVASSASTLPLTAALTGNATSASLQITPGALAFGNIAVGATANLTLTLLNTGNATVTGIATSLTGANAADFAVTVPCSSTSLAPNQGCTVTVSFTPSATGAGSASLVVASSDPLSPATIPLTGMAVAAGGSFILTVNGGSSAGATVKSGSPATYSLLVTPTGGFSGAVALTCAPINAAIYATCSLSPSTVALGSGAQSSTVTINTITSASNDRREPVSILLCWLWLPLLTFQRAFRKRSASLHRLWLAPLVGLVGMLALGGCGGGKPPNSGLLYTPAGSYSYQVTATSTSGTQITQTVTMNLSVQ